MLDDTMRSQLAATLPTSLPTILVSSASGLNIQKLKDLIVKMLVDNDETTR